MPAELPDPVQRERLVAALANVTRRLGWRGLVQARLLSAESPALARDWTPDPAGAARTLARLAAHAELSDLAIELRVGRTHSDERWFDAAGHGHDGGWRAAAWFAGIEDGVCRFGLDDRKLDDPQLLFGTLAHEVAHAYRERARVVAADHELEERLTDVTTVWLGFGALTLACSEWIRTGTSDEYGQQLSYAMTGTGYLTQGDLAWLLAVVVTARGESAKARKLVMRSLPANQAELLRAALELLEDESTRLRGELELPEPSQWGARREAAPEPPPITVVRDPPAAKQRVRAQRKRTSAAVLGAVIGLLGAFAIGSEIVDGFAVFGAASTGALVGGLAGALLRTDRCGACDARVALSAQSCAGCGALLDARPGEPAAGDDRTPDAEPSEPAADDADGEERSGRPPVELPPHARSFYGLLYGWLIARDLLSPEGEERRAQHVVAVRTGTFSADTLCDEWAEVADSELGDRANAFLDWYLAEGHRRLHADCTRLTTLAAWHDDAAWRKRVWATLDSQLERFEGGGDA